MYARAEVKHTIYFERPKVRFRGTGFNFQMDGRSWIQISIINDKVMNSNVKLDRILDLRLFKSLGLKIQPLF